MSPSAGPRKPKVLLVNPNRMKPPVGPIALDYLAGPLERSGFAADILDLCFADDIQAGIESYFARNEVFAVAVSLRNADDTFWVTQDFCLDKYKQITDLLKEITSAPIILGGSGFSIMPERILAYYGLDLGIWGEGEFSLPLLLDCLRKGGEYRAIPGLVYRENDGFRFNLPVFLDLEQMPAPPRNLVDNARYYSEGGMAGIETKRGCPKSCIYCVDAVGKGKKVRLRSPASVAREVKNLLQAGVEHFHMCDAEFNIPASHAVNVCLELVRQGLGEKIAWYTYATPKGFSQEHAALFRKAGCAGINFGADSGSESMLRKLGRDHTTEDLLSAGTACRREGITTMYDLLLGGPGESRETLRETIELMRRISPDRVGASMGVRVFAGTRLAQYVLQQGHMSENKNLRGVTGSNYDFFFPIYYLSAELGPEPHDYLSRLIGNDDRFFFFGPEAGEAKNYNYNDNSVLCHAIKAGYRGAYWDILRRLQEDGRG